MPPSSAKTRMIFSMASPIAVEVSNCSFLETKVTPSSLSSWYFGSSEVQQVPADTVNLPDQDVRELPGPDTGHHLLEVWPVRVLG